MAMNLTCFVECKASTKWAGKRTEEFAITVLKETKVAIISSFCIILWDQCFWRWTPENVICCFLKHNLFKGKRQFQVRRSSHNSTNSSHNWAIIEKVMSYRSDSKAIRTKPSTHISLAEFFCIHACIVRLWNTESEVNCESNWNAEKNDRLHFRFRIERDRSVTTW